MSTLHEVKAAAAALPVQERCELVDWLSDAEDIWELRQEQLRRDIQVGLDQVARGEYTPIDMETVKREARAKFEAQRGA